MHRRGQSPTMPVYARTYRRRDAGAADARLRRSIASAVVRNARRAGAAATRAGGVDETAAVPRLCGNFTQSYPVLETQPGYSIRVGFCAAVQRTSSASFGTLPRSEGLRRGRDGTNIRRRGSLPLPMPPRSLYLPTTQRQTGRLPESYCHRHRASRESYLCTHRRRRPFLRARAAGVHPHGRSCQKPEPNLYRRRKRTLAAAAHSRNAACAAKVTVRCAPGRIVVVIRGTAARCVAVDRP
eukprot:COSAG02_NODE_173_length_31245_cov_413.548096_22_plen_240_part_00